MSIEHLQLIIEGFLGHTYCVVMVATCPGNTVDVLFTSLHLVDAELQENTVLWSVKWCFTPHSSAISLFDKRPFINALLNLLIVDLNCFLTFIH